MLSCVRSLCFHNGERKGLWLCACNCAKCLQLIVQNASLPRGHASIRIQQYVGIITCMGLVLLRANEMDREDCTCGEESSTWESQRVTSYGIHAYGESMGLTAHGLLRSLSTSVYIDIFVFSIINCMGENNCMGITW